MTLIAFLADVCGASQGQALVSQDSTRSKQMSHARKAAIIVFHSQVTNHRCWKPRPCSRFVFSAPARRGRASAKVPPMHSVCHKPLRRGCLTRRNASVSVALDVPSVVTFQSSSSALPSMEAADDAPQSVPAPQVEVLCARSFGAALCSLSGVVDVVLAFAPPPHASPTPADISLNVLLQMSHIVGSAPYTSLP